VRPKGGRRREMDEGAGAEAGELAVWAAILCRVSPPLSLFILSLIASYSHGS
jgi:hypothetical protein